MLNANSSVNQSHTNCVIFLQAYIFCRLLHVLVKSRSIRGAFDLDLSVTSSGLLVHTQQQSDPTFRRSTSFGNEFHSIPVLFKFWLCIYWRFWLKPSHTFCHHEGKTVQATARVELSLSKAMSSLSVGMSSLSLLLMSMSLLQSSCKFDVQNVTFFTDSHPWINSCGCPWTRKILAACF